MLNVEEYPQYIDLPHNSDIVVELSLYLFYEQKDWIRWNAQKNEADYFFESG